MFIYLYACKIFIYLFVIFCTGSKETAFIYAITSAGVVYSITHACSSGKLTECSCDSIQHGQTTPEGWKWGGCR